MESDKVCLTVCGVIKAQLLDVGICRIDVIKNDVVGRYGDNCTLCNFGSHNKCLRTHEVLYIIDTKSALNCDVRSAKVLISIKCVDKYNNGCNILVHFLELVLYITDSHCNCHLESSLCTYHSACVVAKECIEVVHYLCLEFGQESVVCLLYCDFRTVTVYILDSNCLCVLLKCKVCFKALYYCSLRIRDNCTLRHVAVCKGNRGGVGLQNCACLLLNRAHNAHDLTKCFPVLCEACNEVNLTCVYICKCVRQIASRGC